MPLRDGNLTTYNTQAIQKARETATSLTRDLFPLTYTPINPYPCTFMWTPQASCLSCRGSLPSFQSLVDLKLIRSCGDGGRKKAFDLTHT
eukprot:scaffold8267_cov37-Tisochrysis_lutea.AAC.1